MTKTEWFRRHFPPIDDNGLLPGILERLEGTPARIFYKIERLSGHAGKPDTGKWSIKKEIGHLIDLEPLWLGRMKQIANGETNLVKADLSNTKTHETDHDSRELADLARDFEAARAGMMDFLRQVRDEDLNKAALHPRLGTPMRLVDLAFFVAEHDDHHLAQMSWLASGD
jgi:uncharacterized damage-inducible protein DinB